MGGRSTGFSIAAGGTNNANLEAILLTSPAFAVPYDGQPIIVIAQYAITFGASATSYTLTLRRGATLTDTIVYQVATLPAVGGTRGLLVAVFTESLAARASVQYSLTYTGAGETGTSSNLGGGIAVFCTT